MLFSKFIFEIPQKLKKMFEIFYHSYFRNINLFLFNFNFYNSSISLLLLTFFLFREESIKRKEKRA